MNLLTYSLQAGIALALVYVFYRGILEQLTFYRVNRLYLLVLPLVCLCIPFLHTGRPKVAMEAYLPLDPPGPIMVMAPNAPWGPDTPRHPLAYSPFTWPHVLEYLLLAGMAFMVLRLLVQSFSLWRIHSQATKLPGATATYATRHPLSPFSFGRNIYIYPPAHSEEDLQRVLEHEAAHVKQLHTLDILLGQVILIVQWWNPFAWLMNRSLRQNLEFMADDAVLNRGVNRKNYQYLLLKVSSTKAPPIANAFTFPSLKKRIAMMNKQPSGRVQVARFILAMPLVVLLLVAFGRQGSRSRVGKVFYEGFVLNTISKAGIPGATITDSVSGVTALSDGRGYFSMELPVTVYTTEGQSTFFRPLIRKAGYHNYDQSGGGENINMDIGDYYCKPPLAFCITPSNFPHKDSSFFIEENFQGEQYDDLLAWKCTGQHLYEVFGTNPNVIYRIGGRTFARYKTAYAVLDGNVNLILVNGQEHLTGGEVNVRYTYNQVFESHAYTASQARKKYGIDQDLFDIEVKPQMGHAAP